MVRSLGGELGTFGIGNNQNLRRPGTSSGIRSQSSCTNWHLTRPNVPSAIRSQSSSSCRDRIHSAGRCRVKFPRSASEAGNGFSRRGPCSTAVGSGLVRNMRAAVTDASIESSVSRLAVEPSIAETCNDSLELQMSHFQNQPNQLQRSASAVLLRGKAVWNDAVNVRRFSGDSQKTARPMPRSRSAPGGGSMEVTTRALVPDLKQEWLDAAEIDARKRRTKPPNLWLGPVRTGRLFGLLEQHKFKQCFCLVRDCLRQDTSDADDTISMSSRGEGDAISVGAKEDSEKSLVGQIKSSKVRNVLFLWILAVCLEALGWADRAVTLFSRCVGLDPGNPIHPYHRGVCLLRLGNAQAAHFDLQLAISQCLAKNRSPPLMFLVARALAASCLWGKMPEVWADFELVRQWCRNPELKLPQLLQKVKSKLGGSYDAYAEAVLAPMPPEVTKRHWASFVISHSYAKKEFPSAKELVCTIGLLRRLPEISIFPLDFLEKHILHFYAQSVPAGQPLFLEKSWCCLVYGKLDVIRFVCGSAAADDSSLITLASEPLLQEHSPSFDSAQESAALSLPLELSTFPTPTVVSQLTALTSFRFGDAFGPSGDEWLVANTDVELICLPLRTLSAWNRKCKGRVQAGNDVSLLRECLLFQFCSERYLQIALEELLELHDALYDSDPIAEWPGLFIIRSGHLQLLARTRTKDVRSPQDGCSENTHELITLGPGDVIGEEDLLGGSPLRGVVGSKVVSHNLEFWILPSDRRSDAEGSGLLDELKLGQEVTRREKEQRIVEAAVWEKTKQHILVELSSCRQRVEYPLLGQAAR